ncbi:MAG: flavodoxin family protein, partial [Eubacteriaceae bacterium]|nr:flavodoxin family protein [Eubacteriaceae bacterium]
EELSDIPEDLSDAVLIGDRGTIRPCIGCFGCWKKTPGKYVVSDGYDSMGELIHASDEVIVYSRLTFGGFSGFVKNVFDRCLSYVLPQFELVDGESHHRKRYPETRSFSFRFRSEGYIEEEKELAESYVRAVCTNIRGAVKEVTFDGPLLEEKGSSDAFAESGDGILILNVSMRAEKSNSAALSKLLIHKLNKDADTVYLRDHLKDHEGLIQKMEGYGRIVLAMPLYVDGMPSQVIKLMETVRDSGSLRGKKIYLLANMGLYEVKQLRNMLSQVRLFCGQTGSACCGALAVSAGELVGGLLEIKGADRLFLRKLTADLKDFASDIATGSSRSDILTGPNSFPRWLYIAIANSGWSRMAAQYGLKKKDLFRQL